MRETLEELLAGLRSRGVESAQLEVKEAVGGAPKSLVETLSAFSNDSGGTILLGLTDPAAGALPAPGFSPEKVMSQVEDMVRTGVVPPVSAEVGIEVLADGARVVRVDVEEGNPSEKPYYVASRGRYAGSYTRPGEGDRKLTHYEIDRLLENRQQPLHDRQPVEDARLEHLDPALVEGYLRVLREREARSFAALGNEEALVRSNVLVRSRIGNRYVPSVAGLLALGVYPQSFFPQLDVTVVVFPTPVKGEIAEGGARFLDNQQCSGAIPYILSDAVRVLIRNMRSSSVMAPDGVGRENRYEYPVEVIRELLANALMHRDYSEQARGAQVQVELYPDRLVVRSPGGIYGAVNPAEFGEHGVSSSRNAVLARILSNLPLPETGYMVAENRGSGIPSIFESLRNVGMQLPDFRVTLSEVEVTVSQMDSATTPQPGRASFSGAKGVESTRTAGVLARRTAILGLVLDSEDGLSTQEIMDGLAENGIRASKATVTQDINFLIQAENLMPTASARSKNRRYKVGSRIAIAD